jgi:Extracellular mutant protein 11
MGLEDYIRARTDQYYPSNTREDRTQSPRQQQRIQANDRFALGNGFPPSRFMRPLPLPFMETQQQQQQHQNDLQLAQQQQEKSIFDTDVENVDDSTITVTSIGDIEARDHSSIHARGGLFDHDVISQDWDGSELSSESGNPQENQIEVVTATTHRGKSTIPSTLDNKTSYDDEYDSRPYDWILQSETAQRPSTALNNRSKRNSLADKPNVSRIPRAKSRMSLQRSDSDPGARARSRMATEKEATATRTVQVPTPGSGYRRMSNFPQNLTTTPNNRFNFKSERPYERLIQQQSPTRQVSGPRPQPGRRDSASPRKHGKARQKLELASRLAKGTLDTTDDDIDDDDEEEEVEHVMDNEEDDTQASLSSIEPQSLSDTTQRKISISTLSDKHHPPNLTSDYPDEILQQMDFSELEQESFDHIPNPLTNHSTFTTNIPPKIKSPPPLPAPRPPAPPPSTAPASEKLDYALNALSSTPAKRQQYMSSMTITEWEDFGDELIGQVGEMLKLIKESRQARRRTTALFEAEIRRRHDETQHQSGDLDRKLAEMKQGGLGVLRGSKPGM